MDLITRDAPSITSLDEVERWRSPDVTETSAWQPAEKSLRESLDKGKELLKQAQKSAKIQQFFCFWRAKTSAGDLELSGLFVNFSRDVDAAKQPKPNVGYDLVKDYEEFLSIDNAFRTKVIEPLTTALVMKSTPHYQDLIVETHALHQRAMNIIETRADKRATSKA